MTDFDVAIVGYGPAGMVLANLLGQQGRRVIVLERYASLYHLPRAACFDDETMRTFQKLGISEQILPGTTVQRGYEWVNGQGDTLLSIEYDDPGHSGWPQLYMMYQPHMESVLDKSARSWPTVEIRQGITVDQLDQFDDHVVVAGVNETGERVSISAAYLVGADGGNGFVRPELGIEMDDYGFQENWLVCDFEMLGDVEVPSFRQICSPDQPQSIVTIGPRHHRFSFMLDPSDDHEEATNPDNVWARVKRFITPSDAKLVRVANYTFRSRIAERWRKHRVILAGDSAHEMPPFLAQGMVSGIRDSRNLAWKLGLVLDGCSADLLDTYQPEREPHVRFITEKAIELGRIQTMRDPAKAAERDARMLAARRANEKPEKIQFPPLRDGLVANHGGLFPQSHVVFEGRRLKFDDAIDADWVLVVRSEKMRDRLGDTSCKSFEALGGAIVSFAAEPGANVLGDSDGILTRWFNENSAAAVIIRPDRYVYGITETAENLDGLVGRLLDDLGIHSDNATTNKAQEETV
jgi:3-(3-hydroxy-phenyl)propionate hydroxylase/flavoprotein hydroxylase